MRLTWKEFLRAVVYGAIALCATYFIMWLVVGVFAHETTIRQECKCDGCHTYFYRGDTINESYHTIMCCSNASYSEGVCSYEYQESVKIPAEHRFVNVKR